MSGGSKSTVLVLPTRSHEERELFFSKAKAIKIGEEGDEVSVFLDSDEGATSAASSASGFAAQVYMDALAARRFGRWLVWSPRLASTHDLVAQISTSSPSVSCASRMCSSKGEYATSELTHWVIPPPPPSRLVGRLVLPPAPPATATVRVMVSRVHHQRRPTGEDMEVDVAADLTLSCPLFEMCCLGVAEQALAHVVFQLDCETDRAAVVSELYFVCSQIRFRCHQVHSASSIVFTVSIFIHHEYHFQAGRATDNIGVWVDDTLVFDEVDVPSAYWRQQRFHSNRPDLTNSSARQAAHWHASGTLAAHQRRSGPNRSEIEHQLQRRFVPNEAHTTAMIESFDDDVMVVVPAVMFLLPNHDFLEYLDDAMVAVPATTSLSPNHDFLEYLDDDSLSDEEEPYQNASPSAIARLCKMRYGECDIKQSECSVCLEDFEEGAPLTKMPCSHAFHELCILRWLLRNHVCPLCRFKLPTTEEEHRADREIIMG